MNLYPTTYARDGVEEAGNQCVRVCHRPGGGGRGVDMEDGCEV